MISFAVPTNNNRSTGRRWSRWNFVVAGTWPLSLGVCLVGVSFTQIHSHTPSGSDLMVKPPWTLSPSLGATPIGASGWGERAAERRVPLNKGEREPYRRHSGRGRGPVAAFGVTVSPLLRGRGHPLRRHRLGGSGRCGGGEGVHGVSVGGSVTGAG
jgi:hypothetical protein